MRRDDTIIKIRDGQDILLNLYIPVLGGKGGFGSMLRAIGAQIEKTTNREACRDLAGRRLRDVHTEKRIKDWINRQADRKKEQREKRKKKLQKLSTEPKIEFEDGEYFKTRESLPDQLEDAIQQGLKKAGSSSPPSATITKATSSTITSTTTITTATASETISKVTPSESNTSSSCHSSDDKSTDATNNGTNLGSQVKPTNNNDGHNASEKRKISPTSVKDCKHATNIKRSRTTLWTGIDEDELSSDEEEKSSTL